MKYGLIEKVAATPANVLDDKVLKNVCPRNKMVFADILSRCCLWFSRVRLEERDGRRSKQGRTPVS